MKVYNSKNKIILNTIRLNIKKSQRNLLFIDLRKCQHNSNVVKLLLIITLNSSETSSSYILAEH